MKIEEISKVISDYFKKDIIIYKHNLLDLKKIKIFLELTIKATNKCFLVPFIENTNDLLFELYCTNWINNDNGIIVFHKDDWFFFKNNSLNENEIKRILNRNTDQGCQICYEDCTNTFGCQKCLNQVCLNCFKKCYRCCPFCRERMGEVYNSELNYSINI